MSVSAKHKTKVLIVEPDRVLADTYAQALRQLDFVTKTCATAQAGVHACDTDTPDIVVLELQLVEHSGIEFLYELRSYPDWQSIPVIIQSHVPPGEFADNWQLLKDELGVVTYLYKPQSTLKDLQQSVQAQQVIVAQ